MATAEHRPARPGPDELARALRSVDPRVVLVAPRVFRRVFKGLMGPGRHAWSAPSRGGFAARGEAVLALADRDEVGLGAAEPVPAYLILMAEPDDEVVDEAALVRAWRALFHARVHLAYEERADLAIDEGWATARAERLGRVAFAEARQVLVEDAYLVLPADDRSTFVEFAAVYLELSAFRPDGVADTFPAIEDHEAVRALLAEDLDADALLDATRPPGAPARPTRPADHNAETDGDAPPDDPRHDVPPSPETGRWARLKARASAASERGNNVRAAILKVRAARVAPPIEAPRTLASARSELETLSRRLRAALGFDADEDTEWRQALPALLDRASRGLWPREARLLSDLQKVCVDHERPIFAVDLAGWALTLGRRPLRRALPDQREVVVLKHLRAASRRLRALRGPEPARSRLVALSARAIDRTSVEIRDRFRDRLRDTLDRVGLCPSNPPERAARRKLVEELLDLIVARGFVRIGDLRDAISRNGMKLPDLSGPGEFFKGDSLLRADSDLARTLDGVYPRGEFYLRGLQRGSSLAFGTRTGRFLTRFVALPFGTAFVALEGLQHIVGPLVHALGGGHLHLLNPASFVVLSLLLLGLINSRGFRSAIFRAFGRLGRGFRLVFVDAPRWLLGRRLVRLVVESRAWRFVIDWLGKPIPIVVGLSLILAEFNLPEATVWTIRAAAYLLAAILINSRSGRDFEEIAADGASRVGQRIWRDLLPNLFRGVMDFFAAGVELAERLIYAVDERLRFRGGEGRLTLGAKAVVGLVWGAVAYVARFYINLLIEPQINPIKHFPVVTVSHKMMLPMLPQVLRMLRSVMAPVLGVSLAEAIAWPTLFLLPGVFGFLVWELKENWRLYAANRPKTLRPVPIGHHGETLSRLLRRGFHSGTVPKLFAKLRKAERRAEEGRRGRGKAEAARRGLEHVEEAVRHLIDRGVVYLLDESRSAGECGLRPGTVECATNRIVVELPGEDPGGVPARLAFEESAGRLRARIVEPGWMLGLPDESRRALTSALAGLYAMGNVDIADAPDAEPVDLRACPVAWSAWVETWERDADGGGHEPVVPKSCRLVPSPEVSGA